MQSCTTFESPGLLIGSIACLLYLVKRAVTLWQLNAFRSPSPTEAAWELVLVYDWKALHRRTPTLYKCQQTSAWNHWHFSVVVNAAFSKHFNITSKCNLQVKNFNIKSKWVAPLFLLDSMSSPTEFENPNSGASWLFEDCTCDHFQNPWP